MSTRFLAWVIATIAALVVATWVAHGALAATVTGAWGKAIEVPGTAALNTGGLAQVNAISCASAGNCSAGGYYTDHAGSTRPFAVTEKKNSWAKAVKISGPDALNASKFAQITTISCGSPGNCLAGGAYALAGGKQAFIVAEKNGSWGKATAVPGLTSLDSGYVAEVEQVTCNSTGNCAVAGIYSTLELSQETFVVSEKNGKWSQAVEIPGTAQLNQGGRAHVTSLSCPSAGNCAVAGDYRDIAQLTQAFVDTEKNGAWDVAVEVPGVAALNAGGDATATSISCPKSGNCLAGGDYQDSSNGHHAFVVAETSGSWGQATIVSGSAAFSASADVTISAVSCVSAGNCVAGGSYTDVANHSQAFTVTQAHGTWGKATELPGSANLNKGGNAQVSAIACRTTTCVLGGSYRDSAGLFHALVATEPNGAWTKAIAVPGLT